MTFPVFIKASRSKISIAKEIREVSRLRLQFEKSLERSLIRVFSKFGKAAAKEFEDTGSVVDAVQPMQQEIGQILFAHSTAVLTKFGNRVFENRKLSFESLINTFYSNEQASKVVGIAAATRNQINRAILNAEKEGLGVQQTAKLIRERTSGAIGRSRASTIARTETHAAASFANHEAQNLLKLPNQKKRWVSVGDGRTRSHHAAANGQEVGMDEKFVIRFKGQEILMNYPHDGSGGGANNVNCRCLAVYFSDEDEIVPDIVEDTEVVLVDLPEATSEPTRTGASLITISNLIINVKTKKKLQEFDDHINDNTNDQQKRIINNNDKPEKIKNSKRGRYYHQGKELWSDLDRETLEHEYGHHIDHILADQTDQDKVRGGWLSLQDTKFQQAFLDDAKDLGLGEEGITLSNGILGHQLSEGFTDKLPDLKAFLLESVEKTKKKRSGRIIRYKTTDAKFEGATGISDIIDAMTSGRFYTNYHAWGHGVSYYRRTGSKYYETFANLFSLYGRPKAWKEVNKLFPNLAKRFEEMMEELDVG